MKALRVAPLVLFALIPAAAYSPSGEARSAADCSVRSTGLTPLTDMGRQRYHGFAGGLYPGATNRPSRRYLRRGTTAARKVRPIRGKIGFVGVGMSNAMDEFQAFAKDAAQDPTVSGNLVFVDGPGGGWDAVRVSRPRSRYWNDLDELRQNWAVDQAWEPRMDAVVREDLYRDWKRAVERSFNWIEEQTPA